jgi:hypothetical protein
LTILQNSFSGKNIIMSNLKFIKYQVILQAFLLISFFTPKLVPAQTPSVVKWKKILDTKGSLQKPPPDQTFPGGKLLATLEVKAIIKTRTSLMFGGSYMVDGTNSQGTNLFIPFISKKVSETDWAPNGSGIGGKWKVLSLVYNNGRLLAGTERGLFVSLNEGTSWTDNLLDNFSPQPCPNPSIYCGVYEIVNKNNNYYALIYNQASGTEKVYLSTCDEENKCSQWKNYSEDLPDFKAYSPSRTHLAVSNSYIILTGNEVKNIAPEKRSNNGYIFIRDLRTTIPTVWKDVGPPGDFQITSLVSGGDNVYASYYCQTTPNASPCGDSGIFVSRDGGRSWGKSQFPFRKSIFPIYLAAYKNAVFAALDTWDLRGVQVYASTDAGNTWTRISEGLPVYTTETGVSGNTGEFVGLADGILYLRLYSQGAIYARSIDEFITE